MSYVEINLVASGRSGRLDRSLTANLIVKMDDTVEVDELLLPDMVPALRALAAEIEAMIGHPIGGSAQIIVPPGLHLGFSS